MSFVGSLGEKIHGSEIKAHLEGVVWGGERQGMKFWEEKQKTNEKYCIRYCYVWL